MSTEIWLMVDPVGDQVFPVSTCAFDVITAPRDRVLARNCVALFLDANGVVRRIEAITPERRDFWSRVRPWLGLPVRAHYTFVDVDITVDDFRTMLLDAIMYSREKAVSDTKGWWVLNEAEDVVRTTILAAKTLGEIHAAVPFPSDDACLDLL